MDAETLFSIVAVRARLMDECISSAKPSGMLAVIGIPIGKVEDLCREVTATGEPIQITNDNAPGQCPIGGTGGHES